jgi:hypothetical protein
VCWEELDVAVAQVGEFGSDNRAGIQGTLHRISGLRNRQGRIIGLTCRVGRAVSGHADIIRDILEGARRLKAGACLQARHSRAAQHGRTAAPGSAWACRSRAPCRC